MSNNSSQNRRQANSFHRSSSSSSSSFPVPPRPPRPSAVSNPSPSPPNTTLSNAPSSFSHHSRLELHKRKMRARQSLLSTSTSSPSLPELDDATHTKYKHKNEFMLRLNPTVLSLCFQAFADLISPPSSMTANPIPSPHPSLPASLVKALPYMKIPPSIAHVPPPSSFAPPSSVWATNQLPSHPLSTQEPIPYLLVYAPTIEKGSSTNENGNIASLLRDRRLFPPSTSRDYYCRRLKLFELATDGEVFQTSGNVNEIKIKEELVYIASSAIATPNENRAGNLMSIDLTTLTSEVYNVHSSRTQGVLYYQTVSDLIIYQDRVVTSGFDKKVMVLEDDEVIYICSAHHALVSRLCQHPTLKQWVVSAAENGTLIVHDVSTLNSFTLPDPPEAPITHIEFSPFPPHYLYVSTDRKERKRTGLLVYDIFTKKRVIFPSSKPDHVLGCLDVGKDIAAFAFSPIEPIIALATYDATEKGEGDRKLHFIDSFTFIETQTLKTGQKDVNMVGYSPCGRFVYSCGTNNSIVVYDLIQNVHNLFWLRHDSPKIHSEVHDGVCDATWLPNSNLLVTGGADGCLKFWDISKFTLKGNSKRYFPFYFDQDWKSCPPYHCIQTKLGPISKFRFSEDETWVVVAGGSTVACYSLKGNHPRDSSL